MADREIAQDVRARIDEVNERTEAARYQIRHTFSLGGVMLDESVPFYQIDMPGPAQMDQFQLGFALDFHTRKRLDDGTVRHIGITIGHVEAPHRERKLKLCAAKGVRVLFVDIDKDLDPADVWAWYKEQLRPEEEPA